jgi:hypothetical protein
VLNTDRYVATVAPLASDPAVQTALINRITTAIVDKIDIPGLITQLTDQLSFKGVQALGNLASGPINDFLTSFIQRHVQEFVQSPAFITLWTAVNRLAHTAIVSVLTGKKNGVLEATGDQIVLNVAPIVDAVKNQLVASGFNMVSKVPDVNVSFTLVQAQQLPKIQKYVRLLNAAANWLPWLILVLFAAAIWLAPDRRRAAVVGLIAAIVVLIIVLIANQIIRQKYVDQLHAQGRSVAAGTVIYDDVIHYLLVAVRTALFAFIVTAIWAWLAGPGRAGRAVRGFLGRGTGAAAEGLGWPRTGFLGFVDHYRPWIFGVLGFGAFLILLNWPTAVTVAWLLVVALIISACFSIIHRLRTPAVAEA